MSFEGLLFQALNGLASASGLFFVAAGLSLIFGVTRIVNIAHGSLYMLGTYIAVSLATHVGGAFGFWGGILASAIIVGLIGVAIEVVLLRRIYRAPELFQLLATFALVLVINDATLWLWGPEDLLGPRAPGLRGAVEILGRRLPTYDAFLIAVAPAVLYALHLAFTRTRFGRLVRAATQDREMVGALGVNQAMLFTAVFALGAFLAGLGGALQMAREPANLAMDLNAISDAFVVVVVGGMGSIVGAYVAAIVIAEVKALCIGIGVVHLAGISVNFSKFTLVAEFLVMAVVLIVRPHGLLGRPQIAVRGIADPEDPIRPASGALKIFALVVLVALAVLPLLARSSPYTLVLGIDVLIAILFATSLHFIMGPGGMHSFGHAAYFGLGAYGAALLVKWFAAPMMLGACHGARGGRDRRADFRLVRGAAFRRLSRHADARLRADRVVDRVPVAGDHRRLERHPWRLAKRAIRRTRRVLSARARARHRRRFAAAADAVCAVRLCDAGRPRFPAARGSHRHQRQARALARFRHGGRILRRGRRPVRFRQRVDLAGDDQHRALHRRAGDGAAGRHPDADRPDRRRIRVRGAAGHGDAADRILARDARRHHSRAGARVSCRPRRRVRAIHTAQGAAMTELSVVSLTKAFGAVRAVDGVSFAVSRGEFLALIGPNGAGKTTCFNVINGQLPADSGEVRFAGKNIAGLPPREICRLGVGRTFQIAATFGSMTVVENVQMALIAHNGETYRPVAACGGASS